ncbi:ABC transporter family protein [Anoxybacillus sp. B7M1]|jgi:ABC-type sugar transport system ATPase subunit|uniref:sugar ABC transporter ATP-binding protein n=2 Tax=unclassified Anoxybacillus TaxID=2639704 RepID=UPI0005CD47A0|nr:sugar ABC transporter ATP-binding protein [Anoxybacillus sp. B7M1]ANB57491.1 ABC transporter family protein [Anoxybacillus sp. B2M1]ANB63541.1 ABC transporter family protein [Anoxybacillus sp. B7M1]
MSDREVILELKGITKEFPGVKSLDNVHFSLKKGEVHALMGENGAGKSTLMKIVSGVYAPDSGDIYYKGKKVKWNSPLEAREKGISIIHQELKLAPNLTVGENVLMGAPTPKNRFGFISWNDIHKQAKTILESIGSDLDTRKLVSTLSVAQQQIVEIARALSIQADVMIMDEPTATLTNKEIDKLFALIELLKSKGVGIVYISHRMEEIFKISDRCTVLRDGQYVATLYTKDTNEKELVKLMVGREVTIETKKKSRSIDRKSLQPVLEVEHLQNGTILKDGTFKVYPGEVVGIAGLVGSGRSELLQAIFGHTKASNGIIKLNGERIYNKSPKDAIAKGIALVPESRKEQSLFLELGVGENISVLKASELNIFGFIRQKAINELEETYKTKLNVKTPSLKAKILHLSGGNQQKAIIARWLSVSPKVLLLDEPTRGVDVGAKSEIYDIIFGLTEEGYSVVIVSSELPEIIALSDRVYVMHEGRIVGELEGEQIHQEIIMTYATGGYVK